MGRRMQRGKRQVVFNYLPGKTFDFAKTGTIARVSAIRGLLRNDLNMRIVLRKVASAARAWGPDSRPVLRDEILSDAGRFILIDPRSLQAEMFPRVFWCDNRLCGRIQDFSGREGLPDKNCKRCSVGNLVQLRFVRIHRCGALEPLTPLPCSRCHSTRDVSLDLRGSERVGSFRWVCRKCGSATSLFGGYCPHCKWSGDDKLRKMDIEVHRAGRTYYAHTTVLLNVPQKSLDALLNTAEWPAVAAGKYLDLPEVRGRRLSEWTGAAAVHEENVMSANELDDLLDKQSSGELTAQELVERMRAFRYHRQRRDEQQSQLIDTLVERTGVPWPIWQQGGQEILEAVLPAELGRPIDVFDLELSHPAAGQARRMGVSALRLVADYPILTATFGYSRADYNPRECRLNPFPAEREYDGRFPIYVDEVQADALLVSLDARRVLAWLERLGLRLPLPQGSAPALASKAAFVQLLHGAELSKTIRADTAQLRLVFVLLHTLSHMAVRQAALLCGLEATSLSEYMLPSTLSFALYCNHRFGATIGALSALFEQSLAEWLTGIQGARDCVYDPVCRERESSCHACTHLAETSCRHFNLNLSRAVLYGGHDPELGYLRLGYFDPSLGQP